MICMHTGHNALLCRNLGHDLKGLRNHLQGQRRRGACIDDLNCGCPATKVRSRHVGEHSAFARLQLCASRRWNSLRVIDRLSQLRLIAVRSAVSGTGRRSREATRRCVLATYFSGQTGTELGRRRYIRWTQ